MVDLTKGSVILNCGTCPLDKAPLTSPKMKPTGAAHPEVYMLGEGPGKEEDETAEQFVGEAGETLREQIPEEWANRIRWNNVIRCRPKSGNTNRAPTPLEIACCRRLQEEDIATSKPKAVFGFGNVPLQWMTGEVGIQQWRGRRIPCRIRDHTFWFYPMLHPSYVNRIRNNKKAKGPEWEWAFQFDLQKAFAELEEGLDAPFVENAEKDFLAGIVPILSWDVEEVHKAFEEMKKEPVIGLDIETNGLRPHVPGAKILSIAFGTYEKTYAVPLDHSQVKWTEDQRREIDEMVLAFLLHSGTKCCHNTKFEQEWLSFFYGNEILFETEWADTMAQAYVLDEREGKALGDVTLINMGFNLKKYSKVRVEALDKEPLRDVLLYNGPDAKYCQAVYLLQKERIEREGLTAVYEMMNRRCVSVVLTQRHGLPINTDLVQEWDKKLKKQLATTEAKIAALPDVQKWQQKEGMTFDPGSTQNLVSLMRDHLKIKEGVTDEGGYTTEESVLSEIKHPIGKLILGLREDATLHTRYVIPYLPNGKHVTEDGMVYGEFHHLITRTGRLSSESPNLQNFPKRKHKEIRDIIQAPEGYWVVSFDYGQIEARVMGMASKDPRFCKQLWTDFNIHSHWANRILKVSPEWMDYLIDEFQLDSKDEKKCFYTARNETKNSFVFAQFYGSHFAGCAKMMNIPERKLEIVANEFWSDYKGVKEWQERLHERYYEIGYVECLTGRRRRLPLGLNERVNSPIQGTASDIVVDGMERLSVMAYEQDQPHLQQMLNVHDDLTFLLPDRTLDEDVPTIAREMLMCRYNFINVPIVVEVSAGKSWGTLHELGVFRSTDYPEWMEVFGKHDLRN